MLQILVAHMKMAVIGTFVDIYVKGSHDVRF